MNFQSQYIIIGLCNAHRSLSEALAATGADQLVFAVIAHAGSLSFYERVLARPCRTVAYRQEHACQLTSFLQKLVDLINLQAHRFRRIPGEVANGALSRFLQFGNATRNLHAFRGRHLLHGGSFGHLISNFLQSLLQEPKCSQRRDLAKQTDRLPSKQIITRDDANGERESVRGRDTRTEVY